MSNHQMKSLEHIHHVNLIGCQGKKDNNFMASERIDKVGFSHCKSLKKLRLKLLLRNN